MKKKILITASIFASLAILAQNKINFHTIFNTKTFNISEIDTIRFSDGHINIGGSVSESISIAEVDSATFTLTSSDTYGDTVFVTFDGDDAMVQNPYSNISVTTDGANVSINSAADIKGVVYYLSGSSDNGSFSLTPDRAFTLVLDNLSLSCSNAPIVLNLGEDGESYAATVNMRGASTLKDGEASTYKGAIYSKSKLKFYDEKDGSLEIYGNTKHAINGSKHVEIYGGEIIVKSAIGDGLNADGLEMYGGLLSAMNFAGDGVQCSESIEIEDGKIEIVSSADDAKGLKADSSIVINGGSIDINMSGAAAKGIKSALQPIEINGGKLYVQTSGNALITSGDSSFASGLKSDSDVIINGGEIILECSGENGKCIAADLNIIVSGGSVSNIVNGNGAKALRAKQDVLISGGTVVSTLSASNPYIGTGNDHSYNSALNADGNIQISGDANVSVSGDGIAAKALKCDGNALISGGEFTADLT
ncbi:MAG: carbohydrate-binding domain-containing protein, partial [Paludibacteraceae bacterium]|nr:carbohydrate-binding domain-containing protein [Paludibacteraceae bacterium]